ITWVDSNAGVLTQGVTYTVEPLSDGQRFTARSVIKMTPKQEHDNQTFTCQAQNTADRAYRAASILIEVICTADANPNNLTIRWVLSESIVGNSSELVIHNLTRHHNGATVKCMVFNGVGRSEETETLQRVGKTANLTLTTDTHTAGRYLCKATVEGFPEIQAEASIFLKGPPNILSNNTQFGSQGDTVNIECAAFAVPSIDNIVWTFEGKEIDGVHDQDYAFQEDLQNGGIVNSTLIIRESQSKHFGVYKCNVSNEFGSDALEITLRQNKSFPLIMILFGVTSGTIMVAAVIMLVILCQRKQRKNKQQVTEKPDVTVTAEELFKDDRNSNISDLKLELRQANGSCEIDYSNTGSDSTLCSNAKLGSGIPLAGTVPLAINSNTFPYRYSNDYSDPAYNDYKANGYSTYVHYGHDYTPGSLRVQSPTMTSEKLTPNRLSNSLQRGKRQDSSNGLNNLGVPSSEVSRVPNCGILHGVDVRYAATYGNPHLRSGLGYSTVNTAKPASTPAPPPYSSVRTSVIIPSGSSSHSITSPPSLASPQCATSPITNSTISTDSTQPMKNQVLFTHHKIE
ncbi:unnamed protein product, partial [Leptidea sinapis]